VTFDVISLSQATAAILAQVSENAEAGKRVGHLAKYLTHAIELFNQGDLKHALNELYSFQKEAAKVPAPDNTLADAWIRATQQIIDAANAHTRLAIKLVSREAQASGLDNVFQRLSGEVQITLGAEAGLDYVVEVSEDLVNWQTLTVITNSEWSQAINDPDAGSFSHRFYRVRPLQ